MKFILTYSFLFFLSALTAQDATFICHQQEVDLVPLEELNSKSIEFSPVYYQKGLVYVVAKERNRLLDPKTGQAYFDLMYADLAPNGAAGRSVSFSPNIQTQYHEGPCTFNGDDTEIFFTRSNLSGGQGINSAKGEVQLKIYHGIKGAEDWEDIKELPFCSNEYSVAHPALSPDGRFLVFASNMPGSLGGMDLYIVERADGRWLEPKNLGAEINSKGNDLFPSWHEEGYLFYSSDGKGGFGGLDVYASQWTPENIFSGVQHLDFPFNGGRDDLGFIVAKDGRSGYFASDRKPTQGKDDLYQWSSVQSIFCNPSVIVPILVSREILITNESGDAVPQAYAWLIPMNEDGPSMHREAFNTELVPKEGTEGSFYLRWGITDTLSIESADAVSGSDGRIKIDIEESKTYAVVVQHKDYVPYTNVIPAELLPAYIRLVKAPVVTTSCYNTQFTVYNSEGSLVLKGAQINLTGGCIRNGVNLITNMEGNTTTCLPVGCQIKADISQSGFAPHSFLFTPTEEDEHWTVYLKSSATLTAPPAPIATGTVIVLDNIYYDFNKSEIRKGDAGELQALADILKKYPDLTIELTSHTDTRGTAEYNMELSRRRSESSKSYLMLLGVNGTRIVTKASGESTPRNRCVDDVPCSEVEHQYNRRTEVTISNPAEGMEVRYKAKG
ncbi:MAG: OmpA family protein [Bacteroidota bacterium]|nr:OmpA family protein [Bacteroidota bacterium]